MTIDVIIPNYNGSRLIAKNLPAVIKSVSKHKNIFIRIVDDGSREDEKNNLADIIEYNRKKTSASIILMSNTRNVGFSSNINRAAFASKADILVFLNSDVCPDINFLDPLLAHFDNEEVFGVGCMEKSIEGSKTVLRGRGIGIWKRGFLAHFRGEVDKNDTLWISCGSCAVRREIFTKKLRGLDNLYNPFYWEDIDLSYKAQKMGYKVIFENKSIVEHHHAEGAIKTQYKNDFIKTIAYRNQIIFVWKNITDTNLLISHILWLPYYIVKALLDHDTVFIKGLIKALGMLPTILSHRMEQKKQFVKSDKEILSKFSKEMV